MPIGDDLIPPSTSLPSPDVYFQRKKVLEELEDLASKLIKQHGSQERSEDDFLPGLKWAVHDHLEYSKNHDLDTEEVHQIFGDEHRVDYMLSILKGLTKVIGDVHRELKTHLKPISSKLSKGLSSLPDDVLSLIFEFANPPGEGTQQAVWLSHVSRRFRRVAFGACNLWTTLHSFAEEIELDTLIARSGTTSGLGVELSIPSPNSAPGILHTYPFVEKICIPLASRVKTLAIWSGLEESDDPDDPETVDEMMSSIFDRYPQLDLPRLEELRIAQHRFDIENGTNSWTTDRFVPSWTMPKLQYLVCDEYTPLPSPVYSSVRSFTSLFSLSTDHHPFRFADLLTFLDSAKAITDLNLTFRTFVNEVLPMNLTKTHCNALASLSLHLAPFIFRSGSGSIMQPLIASFVIPNLTSFSVSIEFYYDNLLRDPEDPDALSTLIYSFLPNHLTHTKLTSVSIELTHTKETRPWGAAYVRRKTISIPLEEIPYVTSLNIKTFCGVVFNYVLAYGTFPLREPLRELRLRDCYGYDMEMLKETVASLKSEEIWETLESLTLERCLYQNDYEAVLKEVGEERLSFIPCHRKKFCT